MPFLILCHEVRMAPYIPNFWVLLTSGSSSQSEGLSYGNIIAFDPARRAERLYY